MIGKIVNQFAYQFGNYILPFLIIPFLINELSLGVYRDLVIFQTLVIFFAVLVNYGLDLYGVRYISYHSNVVSKCKRFVYISLITKLFIFTLIVPFLFASLYILTHYNLLYWILSFFWLSSFVLQLNWYFQGVGEFQVITKYGLLPKLILYPFVFFCVKNDSDAWVYLFLCGLANYISNMLMLCQFTRSNKNTRIKINKLKLRVFLFVKKGWYIFLSQASVTLISYTNVFILPLLLDTKSFVVFSTADRIVKVLSIATTPVLNVLFPYISLLIHRDRAKAFTIITKMTLSSILIFAACYILFMFSSDHILELVFPKISKELQTTLLLLLFNVIFVFINNLYGTQIALNCGKDKIFSKIIAFNGFMSLLLMSWLGYLYQLNGVIFASLIVQFSILISMYLLAKKCGYNLRFK